MNVFFPVFGYFIGAIPFGLLVGRFAGIDVRTQGSKNIGATNVSRVLGKKFGVITLIFDCCKGILPMLLADRFLPAGPAKEAVVGLTGLASVVGHMFPIYLGFRGGKGVATGLGVFLFLSPLSILVSLACFLGVVTVTGFVSVGSLLASALMPLWLYLFGASKIAIMTATVIALLVWIKHHENIGRLLRGEEKTWKKAKT